MATYYGSYVTRTSGSSTRSWRARLDYSYTETDTTFTVTFACWLDLSGGSGTTISISSKNKATATLYIAGANVKSTSLPASGSKSVNGSSDWQLQTYTATYQKTNVQQTKTCTMSVTIASGSAWGGTSTATLTGGIVVPALASYAVSYNVNGGTGTIADDSKWYGEDLILSDGTGFSYTNHTLIGWNTAADGSSTHYDLGGTYSTNDALILYAEWELNALQVKTKVSGTWYPSLAYVKVNGTWYQAIKGYVKVNGTWYQLE